MTQQNSMPADLTPDQVKHVVDTWMNADPATRDFVDGYGVTQTYSGEGYGDGGGGGWTSNGPEEISRQVDGKTYDYWDANTGKYNGRRMNESSTVNFRNWLYSLAAGYGAGTALGVGAAGTGAGAAGAAAGELGAAGAATGGATAGGISAAEAAAALGGAEAAGGAAAAASVESAALAAGYTAGEASALGTAAASGGATQTIVVTGVKAGLTTAEIAAGLKVVAPVVAAGLQASASSGASQGSSTNENYSNEGNNYPNSNSTQGPGGSPVNASTTGGSGLSLSDVKTYGDLLKGVFGVVSGGNQAQMGQAAVQLGLAKQAEADRLIKDALAKIEALTPPDLLAIAKPLKEQVFLGKLTPEQYVVELQKQSALNGIKIDPAVTQAQYDALNQFKEIADNKGLTPGDRAQLAEISSQEAMKARGARDALSQQAQQRGVGGSGLDMVSQMIANQGAASDASSRGNQVAIEAQRRALSALSSQADLSTKMANDSFNQQAQVATAQDAVDRYNNNLTNTANFANVDKRNTAAKDAQEHQYQVNKDNTTIQHQQQQQQIDAANQAYKNQYGKTAMYGDVASKYASDLNRTGQATSAAGAVQQSQGEGAKYDAWGKLITSDTGQKAIKGLWDTAVDWYGDSDKNLKKNVKPVEADEGIDDLLDKLTGYKYTYKKKVQDRNGSDEYQGVMAQDLEKSKLGSEMVSEGEDGKQVDSKKAMEAALMALKRMNARLSKLEG